MLNPASRRGLAVVLALAAAILACARAEVPITPAVPQISTPLRVAAAPQPETAAPSGYPGPTSPPAPAATSEAYPGPAEPTQPATEAPTATSVIQPTPSDTPTITHTPPPTDTPQPTATFTPAIPTLPPSSTPGRTNTPSGPAPTAPPAASATPPPGPQPIPIGAEFTRSFTIANEGGLVFGRPQDMIDGREETWASLRGGNASWVLDLGSPQNVVGLRVFARPDGSDPTTLTQIAVSQDGSSWSTVFTGSGNCGVPSCETLPQREYVELGFSRANAQYVRLTSGPTRFAFAEIEVAVLP